MGRRVGAVNVPGLVPGVGRAGGLDGAHSPWGAQTLWRGRCALLWELVTAGSLCPRPVASHLQGQGRKWVVSQDQGLMCWDGGA